MIPCNSIVGEKLQMETWYAGAAEQRVEEVYNNVVQHIGLVLTATQHSSASAYNISEIPALISYLHTMLLYEVIHGNNPFLVWGLKSSLIVWTIGTESWYLCLKTSTVIISLISFTDYLRRIQHKDSAPSERRIYLSLGLLTLTYKNC